MPGTYTPGQMYDHELNPSKGWPSPYAVDKVLPIYIEDDTNGAKFGGSTNFNYMTDFKAGMVCHVALDAGDGQYKLRLGLAPDAMPLFLFPNGRDTDVTGDKGNIIGSGNAAMIAAVGAGKTVAGNIVALVAKGAYELETTEFVSGTYAPNAPLTAVGGPATDGAGVTRTATESDNPGKIKPITWAQWRTGDISDEQHRGCIGTVADGGTRYASGSTSGGVFTNEFGKSMIRFWPEHLPCPHTQA